MNTIPTPADSQLPNSHRRPSRRPAPFDHLAAADALLGLTTAPDAPGIHPRAAAFLLRRALESRLSAYIRHHRPSLNDCRTLTQALWLAGHLDPAIASRYASVWNSLCQACHFHSYTLAPTLTELRSWRDEVAYVLNALPPVPTGPQSSPTPASVIGS